MSEMCPDCGCQQDGWNPRRQEYMETWDRCCGYPERRQTYKVIDPSHPPTPGVALMGSKEGA